MSKIIDQFGRPMALASIAEPQTSKIALLQNQWVDSQLSGITPKKIVGLLQAADQGNIRAQHELFEDMFDRDAHMACEYGKRKSAIAGLDWSIVPPKDATAAEKSAAKWAEEICREVVDNLDDMLLALMDAVRHGFAAIELEWQRVGNEWLPRFHPRPQTWFQQDYARRELRLMDGSGEGAQLIPFGWIMHQHGLPKTGYISRMGICRVLIWPFLYMHYSLGDFAEFLETYGLPIITGKYYPGASDAEKASLMRAVSALGHDARAIMPQGMELDIKTATAGGEKSAHLAMVDWAERAQSKAILGQTLSAESKPTGLGSGVANLHKEVRHDILLSDSKRIASTLTRDLIYPLITLNGKSTDSFRRCPRWVFDFCETGDLAVYAQHLPGLAAAGARIGISWVHEKLNIPLAAEGEAILGEVPNAAQQMPTGKGASAALKASPPSDTSADPMSKDVAALQHASAPLIDVWLDQLKALADQATDLAELQDLMLSAYSSLPEDELVKVMAAGFALAELKGMSDARE